MIDQMYTEHMTQVDGMARKIVCDGCSMRLYLALDEDLRSCGWISFPQGDKPNKDLCAACWRIEREIRKVRQQ